MTPGVRVPAAEVVEVNRHTLVTGHREVVFHRRPWHGSVFSLAACNGAKWGDTVSMRRDLAERIGRPCRLCWETR